MPMGIGLGAVAGSWVPQAWERHPDWACGTLSLVLIVESLSG